MCGAKKERRRKQLETLLWFVLHLFIYLKIDIFKKSREKILVLFMNMNFLFLFGCGNIIFLHHIALFTHILVLIVGKNSTKRVCWK